MAGLRLTSDGFVAHVVARNVDARLDWQQYTGTRDKLRERLSGVEKNIAEPDAEIKIAGELKPVEKEWRVWQGKDSRAPPRPGPQTRSCRKPSARS